jgi:molybdenum cofactor cytidylyltransferase
MQNPSQNEATIAIIILAAGKSSRMGTPKQLLPYQGKTLLRHITEIAIASVCHPIIVVLGAYYKEISNELKSLPVQIVENTEWATGMGSSIRCGIQALIPFSNSVEAAVILVCDQPFVTPQTINQLVDAYHSTQQPIVASAYENTLGVPALFQRKLFPELSRLNDTEGAKNVIKCHKQSTFSIEFPQGAIDLDTPDGLQQFLAN